MQTWSGLEAGGASFCVSRDESLCLDGFQDFALKENGQLTQNSLVIKRKRSEVLVVAKSLVQTCEGSRSLYFQGVQLYTAVNKLVHRGVIRSLDGTIRASSALV
eukprot:Blabericola_migrator_1__6524@NODE_3290_length_1883_cov_329_768722_g2055_i0_p5_GENE_NODE_3290_length_1883_cov_329_768722_g2055_i0NODE_3290_length_1883_cov_329_768722_g2055_i0_p5_ORF_typecomplete_len104_score14_30_NODE_3290_length_1883_cov_329_768722_g2055_i07821093